MNGVSWVLAGGNGAMGQSAQGTMGGLDLRWVDSTCGKWNCKSIRRWPQFYPQDSKSPDQPGGGGEYFAVGPLILELLPQLLPTNAMNRDSHPQELFHYPLIVEIPVQWGDQDAFGHVNNTAPIRWFESARIRYFEQLGIQSLLTQSRQGPILASITCHYRKQLHYPDVISVSARITRIGRTSMTMAHAVYSHNLAGVSADGDSVVVLFDYAANTPTPIGPEIRTAIEKLEGTVLEP